MFKDLQYKTSASKDFNDIGDIMKTLIPKKSIINAIINEENRKVSPLNTSTLKQL